MENFQDTFETRKQSFISAFSICMSVPLKSKRFLRKPKRIFVYDPRKHHMKVFRSHLQGLAL